MQNLATHIGVNENARDGKEDKRDVAEESRLVRPKEGPPNLTQLSRPVATKSQRVSHPSEIC